MKVYKYNSGSESYDLIATIEDDGTIIGASAFASRVEEVLTRVEEKGVERAEVIESVKEIVERRYNNGHYSTVR
ncbi:hypothetical protein SAMN04488065_0718 [Haloplanus vescus]|uniref:Uncharacterized protein n=1 Tax=Haloplanus vescus TaxID=555874 RepID=A0A1H3WDA0_9EURY|nr:hypothetical protein [Haloplanus vescus]SDZ84312.1 hypothetical protein SAMN04488065_0718 [Haloplanus vescus]